MAPAPEPRKCSMCVIHMGEKAPLFKGHQKCKYKNEAHIKSCADCRKVDNRRKCVAKEKQICYVRKTAGGNAAMPSTVVPNGRVCRKCKNHDNIVPVKNQHKLICPRKNCTCEKCRETDKRRIHSTKFTTLHRQLSIKSGKVKKPKNVEETANDSGMGSDTSSIMFEEHLDESFDDSPENFQYENVDWTAEQLLQNASIEFEHGNLEIGNEVTVTTEIENDSLSPILQMNSQTETQISNEFKPVECLNLTEEEITSFLNKPLDGNVENEEANLLPLATVITDDEIDFVDFDVTFIETYL
jgi:hypothetical protein